MSALADHLWQSLLCVMLAWGLVRLTAGNAAVVRLWLWRIAAVKMLVPFSLLALVGGGWKFPVRFAGDPPPPSLVELEATLSSLFAPSTGIPSAGARVALLFLLLGASATVLRAVLGRIHMEALRARVQELRLEIRPDDREPSVGFVRAALLTTCALVVIALPFLGGSLRAGDHAYQVLQANLATLSDAPVTVRPARPGLGSRYFVHVDDHGVTLRNITLRELTGLAYGVNRFYVRGKHFKSGEVEDWLVDSRHDVRIDGPVIEPDDFDTYSLRHAITRELARNFGLEIYVNSECQDPCGKWADRVLVEVEPGRWRLVDAAQAREAEARAASDASR